MSRAAGAAGHLPDPFPLAQMYPSQAWRCPEGEARARTARDLQPGVSLTVSKEGVSPLRSRWDYPRAHRQVSN